MKKSLEQVYQIFKDNHQESVHTIAKCIDYIEETYGHTPPKPLVIYAFTCKDFIQKKYLTSKEDIATFLAAHLFLVERVSKKHGGILLSVKDMVQYGEFKTEINKDVKS